MNAKRLVYGVSMVLPALGLVGPDRLPLRNEEVA
jgi:hypothetical protein